MTVETTTIPIVTIARLNGVNGRSFTKLYKDRLSGYREWAQLEHAEEYVLHGSNIGEDLSIDETSLSNGEVYTVVTNKAAKGRKGALVAMIRGVASDNVIEKLRLLGLSKRRKVKTVTADLSGSMKYIATKSFPAAEQISDRFHVQQLMSQAIDEMRIELRWDVVKAENEKIRLCRQQKAQYRPEIEANGETLRQIMARSKHIMTRNMSKWSDTQRRRAEILFERYPQLKTAYNLSMRLTDIYNERITAPVARLKLARWHNELEHFDPVRFKTVFDTFTTHCDTIINYFNDRLTNASAESFNAKIKDLRRQFRGINDTAFFIFRLSALYG